MKCTKCELSKNPQDFPKDSSMKSGYRNQCKKCRALYQSNYLKNHDEYRESRKGKGNQYKKNNPIKRKEYNKKNSKMRVKKLTNNYLKCLIKKSTELAFSEITEEMIIFKREQIMFFRELKTLKKEAANGTT